MRAKTGMMLAAGLLTAWAPAMAQRTPTLREQSPTELYLSLRSTTDGVVCYPVGDQTGQLREKHLHARFMKVRPWLVAAIGQADFEKLVKDLDDELGDVDYFGCPSDEYVRLRNRRHVWILQEMERRAKAAR